MAEIASWVVDTRDADRRILAVEALMLNARPMLIAGKIYQNLVADDVIEGQGGRGVQWDPFAESTIGSLRPSGKPVDGSSKLLQDEGTLRRRLVETIFGVAFLEILFGTTYKPAAWHSFGTSNGIPARPYAFWTPEDAEKMLFLTAQMIAIRWDAGKPFAGETALASQLASQLAI